jgi:KDO2-lipid IV(A) lauroyltransferase
VGHALEAGFAAVAFAGFRALGWERSIAAGARFGDMARGLGVRARVARDNLALALPERDAAARERILADHYRELGRVVAEYARLDELARAPRGRVVAIVRGEEHLERARAAGRGAILLSGHYGNIELLGAHLAQLHPVDFVVQPLSNPRVEAMIADRRARAGVGQVRVGTGVREVYAALRANRWIAMLGDQDARGRGVFVPFMGRPTSTATGPARLALATGAALIMGFITRRDDGRHELDVEAPLTVERPDAEDAVERLTAAHVARLEWWVRRHPEMWFWLHRRWKTAPPVRQSATAA